MFEYLFVYVDSRGDCWFDDEWDNINQLGKDGWELVSVDWELMREGKPGMAVFKRYYTTVTQQELFKLAVPQEN